MGSIYELDDNGLTHGRLVSKKKLKEILDELKIEIVGAIFCECYGRRTIAYVNFRNRKRADVEAALIEKGLKVGPRWNSNFDNCTSVGVTYHRAYGWDR